MIKMQSYTINFFRKISKKLMQIKRKYDKITNISEKERSDNPMPTNVQITINHFIQEVKGLLGERLKKVILYGSYARGDFHKNSDIDIMLLTDLDDKEIEEYRDKVSEIAFNIELEKEIYISPIIKNIDKYNARINVVPFYMNVHKEGVEL